MDPRENLSEQEDDLEREQPVNPVRDSGVVDEEAAAGDEKNEEETATTKGEALEIDGGGGAAAAGLNQDSKLQEVAEGGKKKKKKKKGEDEEGGAGGSVSIFKLFAYADSFDYLLILLGTVGAIVHGAALPVFFVIFSKLLNGFGANTNSPDQTNAVVGKVDNPPSSSSSSSEQKKGKKGKKKLLKLLLLLVFCCGICFTFAVHFVFDHLHLSLLDTWPRVMFMLLGFSGICLISVSFVMLKMMMMILGFFNFANTEEVRFTSCHLFFLSQINCIL
jgi:hypothetical protein